MQNTFFMKEPIAYAETNVSVVALNQKQLKPALDFTINTFLAQEQTNLIFVAFSQSYEEILNNVPDKWKKRLFIIDAFSKEETQKTNTPSQVTQIDGAADLTHILIELEKIQNTIKGKKVIVFDAMNMLSIYNKKDTLGKFIHIFCNKTRLEENTALLFTVKDSTDENILDLMNEFADKAYDFSSLFVSAINTLSE